MLYLISIIFLAIDITTHVTTLKIFIGSIITLLTGFGGYKLKKSSDRRKNEEHELKMLKDKVDMEKDEFKTSTEAIENLRKNIERLNQFWVEENTLRTKAEANAIRKAVALDLMKSICPECYSKLPNHLKNNKDGQQK